MAERAEYGQTIVRFGTDFDDYVIDGDGHIWSQVCNSCIAIHKLPESALDDIGEGICGIVGCTNEADKYIDF